MDVLLLNGTINPMRMATTSSYCRCVLQRSRVDVAVKKLRFRAVSRIQSDFLKSSIFRRLAHSSGSEKKHSLAMFLAEFKKEVMKFLIYKRSIGGI